MSAKQPTIALFLVPQSDIVRVPIPENEEGSLIKFINEDGFDDRFENACSKKGYDVVMDECKFLDLGSQRRDGIFINDELGDNIWIVVSSREVDDFEFVVKFTKIINARGNQKNRKEKISELISGFLSHYDIDGIYEFSEILSSYTEEKFDSGECAEFKEKFQTFFEEMDDFMGNDEYNGFSHYKDTRRVPEDDVIKRIAADLLDLREKFFDYVDEFYNLWNQYFNKPEYLLKEDFVPFKNDVEADFHSVKGDVAELKKAVSGLSSEVKDVKEQLADFKQTVEDELQRISEENAKMQKMLSSLTAFFTSYNTKVEGVCKNVGQCVKESHETKEIVDKCLTESKEARKKVKEAYKALDAAYESCGKKPQ